MQFLRKLLQAVKEAPRRWFGTLRRLCSSCANCCRASPTCRGVVITDTLASDGAAMRRCKDPGHAQRFLAADGPITSHFRPRRHRLTAAEYRETCHERFATWRAVTDTSAMA